MNLGWHRRRFFSFLGGLLFSATLLNGWEGRIAIDLIIEARVTEEGLKPVPVANHMALARRLAFDLTGLPPEDRFFDALGGESHSLSIDSLVDALLHSPQFGERMASMWMNVARFAEDQAHQVGNDVKHFYPNAYLYRDWVVKAFNDDLGYDEFIRLQLAADLYDGTEMDDLPALGFLGLGPKYYNRGRLDVMADEWEDRVDTVTRGFLGLTVGGVGSLPRSQFDIRLPAKGLLRFGWRGGSSPARRWSMHHSGKSPMSLPKRRRNRGFTQCT